MSFQDRTQHQIGQLDKELCLTLNAFTWLTTTLMQLSKYPVLNNFEKQTSVPKVYAFLGIVGIYFFLVFFNIAGEFLVNFAGFIIPGYYSLEALFSTGKSDDTQWLTYWVVYAFLTVFESLVNAVYWFRMLKLGAQIVFRSLIQPVFSRYFSHNNSTAANLRSQADQATKSHAM
ncbi:MAG: hypothetical protein Q9167_004954 [Letrouitia subvulpina]